jgi:hypothetical protein
MFPLPDSLASTGGPGASSASLSSLQGSSADVIQLPGMTARLVVFFKVHGSGAWIRGNRLFSPTLFYCELSEILYGVFLKFF